eukprot:TCONS_00030302-protein
MTQILMTLALACLIHQTTGYLNLLGKLVESTGFPITLHCPNDPGFVLVGGITVNNEPLEEKLQQKVKDQCDRQMKKSKGSNGGQGATCSLNLPRVNVSDSDTVRVVYNCHDAEPTGNEKWGEEEKKPKIAEEKEEEAGIDMDLLLACQRRNGVDDVITIERIYLNGNEPPEGEHPDLVPQKMTDKCYGEWTNELENGQSKKYYPVCNIVNTYGTTLKVVYICLGPGSKRKKSGNGEGNENGGGNGKGNNGNGNGNGGGNGNGNNGNGNGNGGGNGKENNGNGGGNGNGHGQYGQ